MRSFDVIGGFCYQLRLRVQRIKGFKEGRKKMFLESPAKVESSNNGRSRSVGAGTYLTMESPNSSSNVSSDFGYFSSPDVRGCRKRKSFLPRRSSRLDDPNFRGATVWMENLYQDNEWKLCIKSKLSLSPRRKRKFSVIDSSDEDEPVNGYENDCEKQCASCDTVKTPLWRDAEDGTPLCNACGIRYKKYKLRCTGCWHIPKKDEFSPRCSCGAFYECVTPRR